MSRGVAMGSRVGRTARRRHKHVSLLTAPDLAVHPICHLLTILFSLLPRSLQIRVPGQAHTRTLGLLRLLCDSKREKQGSLRVTSGTTRGRVSRDEKIILSLRGVYGWEDSLS